MGAWVETREMRPEYRDVIVAPFVGAWVETCRARARSRWSESRPSWARGLKPIIKKYIELRNVAPFVGAWVETDPRFISTVANPSRPSWARGLKHCQLTHLGTFGQVAPFVGAWVETLIRCKTHPRKLVAPFVGAWVETKTYTPNSLPCMSRPSWARGLKLLTHQNDLQ